jgi:1-aminocyclopropane-1-carboxylate deaminase/D-cysteine desulfhydrase-like pyridoxal-dependent ACC family enzyme
MREVADSGIQFDHLVCACGSGGTAAGCTLGAKLYLPGTKVMCSMVDDEPFDVIVPRLMQEAADLLEVSTEIPVPDLLPMWGPGYSIPSTEGNEAVSMMMKLEGIVLDTCYTGKAFAGLVSRAREGFYQPDDNVLFIHTGGAGGLFAQDWEAEE